VLELFESTLSEQSYVKIGGSVIEVTSQKHLIVHLEQKNNPL
jgi:hypothetical protein